MNSNYHLIGTKFNLFLHQSQKIFSQIHTSKQKKHSHKHPHKNNLYIIALIFETFKKY